MEKVKLTKQQANIVKNLPSQTPCGRDALIESHFKQTFQNNWAFLNDLSTDDFIKCFYVPDSYEIEQTEQEKIQALFDQGFKYSYNDGVFDTLKALNRIDLYKGVIHK